jgi:hypothetical protein
VQFVSFEPGIEVSGAGVSAVLDAFNAFSLLASQIMASEGVGKAGDDGLIRADPAGWYSFDGYLSAYRRISNEIGENVLYQLGQVMPKHAQFPPNVTDVPSAFQLMDIAYHMNHRKGGAVMFDPKTGAMLEGIGHYGYEPQLAKKQIISVLHNPYPCAFDRGLYEAMARRFDPGAKVIHDNTKPCRAKGADSCTLIVQWR